MDENGNHGILEFNTNSPGSLFLTSIARTIYEKLPCFQGKFDFSKKVVPQLIDDEEYFLEYLISFYQRVKQTIKKPSIAYLISKEYISSILDRDIFLEIGKRMGLDVFVADISDLEYSKEVGLSYQGQTIDFVWSKVLIRLGSENMFYSNELNVESNKYFQAIKDGKVFSLNSFHSSFVSENKKTLALLYDKRFSHLFNNCQLEAIKQLVIPSYVLHSKDPNYYDLKSKVLSNKDLYVIKGSLSGRGKSIFIGCEMTQEEWEKKLEEVVDGPFMIQKFVKSKVSQVLSPFSRNYEEMVTTFGIYLLGGKTCGNMIRSSPNLITNIHSSGLFQNFFVMEE
ncbi:hypothetical protein PPL_05300 [Heterostelium album PN500]|uniref:Glutathione synthase n=1 Tax=Heterostelium pallidum (strain ATCC 26659 / Pp 5 / PN500) TaxID=670386 RepID=D3BBB3_HETP5|nr:hypothetical protein PPL_05300 [Heterostelium album PN500]EFA81320.1 hypothetical protein PPL_05300 [Heterostelium album PN500]|eukprot:XP_020433438.1 hypothetical protein PPL_05300 [Heterostelium album PN500]